LLRLSVICRIGHERKLGKPLLCRRAEGLQRSAGAMRGTAVPSGTLRFRARVHRSRTNEQGHGIKPENGYSRSRAVPDRSHEEAGGQESQRIDPPRAGRRPSHHSLDSLSSGRGNPVVPVTARSAARAQASAARSLRFRAQRCADRFSDRPHRYDRARHPKADYATSVSAAAKTAASASLTTRSRPACLAA